MIVQKVDTCHSHAQRTRRAISPVREYTYMDKEELDAITSKEDS